tara:strand:+ start:259 stop:489 length:231 start_codon:yes stop_codon:yes gene_type:complete
VEDGKIVVPIHNKNSDVSESVKNRIDHWIKTEGLNEYGDPVDSVYLGGNPLFNEATGTLMDRYEYILLNNPELGKP